MCIYICCTRTSTHTRTNRRKKDVSEKAETKKEWARRAKTRRDNAEDCQPFQSAVTCWSSRIVCSSPSTWTTNREPRGKWSLSLITLFIPSREPRPSFPSKEKQREVRLLRLEGLQARCSLQYGHRVAWTRSNEERTFCVSPYVETVIFFMSILAL